MDKITALLEQAFPAYLLHGNPVTQDFLVTDFPGPLPGDYITRGLSMVGAAGIIDGKPATCLRVPLPADTVDSLAGEVVARISARVARALSNPETVERAERAMFAGYMERLMSIGTEE